MHLLARQIGLVEAIDDRLHLLKLHLPYHESDHVLNLAYNGLSITSFPSAMRTGIAHVQPGSIQPGCILPGWSLPERREWPEQCNGPSAAFRGTFLVLAAFPRNG